MRQLFFLATIIFLFSVSLTAQVSDTIYRVPIGTDRIDTVRYDSTNAIKQINFYSNGKRIKIIAFYKNQNIDDAQSLDEIGRQLWYISWYPNGSQYQIYHHSVGQVWYEDGRLKEETTCENDTCISKRYYESGQLMQMRKKFTGSDRPIYAVDYCENGQIEREDIYGKQTTYTRYFCDGKIECKGTRNAQAYLIGKYCEWNENGVLIAKGQYSDTKQITFLTPQTDGVLGQKDGTWKYYDDKGKLIKTEVYQNGKLISNKVINTH
jgi:antitoxin component YwqK of YwqJK toxin-antitoxin module